MWTAITITAFKKIQKKLFAANDIAGNNVTDHLRSELTERFGVEDGFFWFPIEFGGLGLQNPFIPSSLCYNSSVKNLMRKLDEAFELEEVYTLAKKSYEEGTSARTVNQNSSCSRCMSRGRLYQDVQKWKDFIESLRTSAGVFSAFLALDVPSKMVDR